MSQLFTVYIHGRLLISHQNKEDKHRLGFSDGDNVDTSECISGLGSGTMHADKKLQ